MVPPFPVLALEVVAARGVSGGHKIGSAIIEAAVLACPENIL